MIDSTVSHYHILERLGGGGMGVVYKASDLRLNNFVALKFLPLEFGTDEIAKKRFIQEAQTAASLDHQNICVIHDIDEAENGQLFICMKYYEGESLKKKLQRGIPSFQEAIGIAIQIARGLNCAHEAGIVHRDIKPANVMITRRNEVKIVDFGLAKLAGQTSFTRSGSAIGTLFYMSPEQWRGEKTDYRTDIWSLGILLYELLTGVTPFQAEHEAAVLYSVLNEELTLPSSLNRDIPPLMDQIVTRALEKKSGDRYPSMFGMLEAMIPLAEKNSTAAGKTLSIKDWFQDLFRRLNHPRFKKIIMGGIILFVVFVTAGYFTFFTQDNFTEKLSSSGDANKYYNRGKELYFIDQSKAIGHFEHAVAIDSTFFTAYAQLALLTDHGGDTQKALFYATKLRKMAEDRDKTEYFKALAIEAWIKREFDKSIDYYENYLRLQPDDMQTNQRLAYILLKYRRDYDRAIHILNKSIELDPEDKLGKLGSTYNYLGLAYLYKGQWQQAQEYLRKYIAIRPGLPDAVHSLGDAYLFSGYYKEAIEAYQAVIAELPTYYMAYEDLGQVYLKQGRLREALVIFKRYNAAAPIAEQHDAFNIMALTYSRMGNYPLARFELQQARNHKEKDIHRWWLSGIIAFAENDIAEVKKCIGLIEQEKDNPAERDDIAYLYHLKGRLALYQNNPDSGLVLLTEAAQNAIWENYFFKKELVSALVACDRYADADKEARRLLSLNKNDAEVLLLRGMALQKSGNLEEARECFHRAQSIWQHADTDFYPFIRLKKLLNNISS